MTMATPSFSQIKSQVAAVHQKLPLARVIGIHSNGRWTGDSQKRDGEHALSIHQCDSPLAIRQALREPVDEATTKVLVAPLAATASLLLTVIDGMSVAVARELQADLPKHEWTTLCEPEQPFNRPGIPRFRR